MTAHRPENYLALLTIRRTAGRRDTTILGGIFAASFIATIALGMLNQLSGRSLYLITALVVIFGLV
jgi:4-hydroxybenzoate polyprenyltransferase